MRSPWLVNEFNVPASDFVCGVDATIQETVKVRMTLFCDGNLIGEVVHLNGTARVTTRAAQRSTGGLRS